MTYNETQLFTSSKGKSSAQSAPPSSFLGTFKARFTVNYADSGSIVRCSEEQTYIFFMDFLDECEGKNCVFTMYCITTMYLLFSEERGECTLEDIWRSQVYSANNLRIPS